MKRRKNEKNKYCSNMMKIGVCFDYQQMQL